MVAAPDPPRGRLRSLTTARLVATCGRLRQQAAWDVETATTAASLRALARRIQLLNTEVADHTQAITTLVRAWRPDLLGRCGVGPILAAIVLCAWSHPGRCPSDAAFAMLASSGQTVRVRLNRSGAAASAMPPAAGMACRFQRSLIVVVVRTASSADQS